MKYGDGSITRRKDGRFEVRRMIVDRDGTRKRKGLGTVNTMAEAKRLLAQAPEHYYLPERTRHTDDGRDTVQSFIARWLAKSVKPGRTSTYTLYQQHMRLYVLPVVGEKLLHRLTRADVEAIQHRAYAAGVSASTIGLTLKILTTALNYAINKEELPDVRNVVKGADRVYRIKPRTYTIVTPQDASRILAQAEAAGSRYTNVYALLLYCGLRINEALALRWKDVDFDRRELTVAHSVKHVGQGRRQLGEVKTDSSAATIPLPDVAIRALRAQRRAQMAEQAEADVWLNTDQLVFTAAWGGYGSDSTVRKEWHEHVAAAGLPDLRLHDLRHSCASLHDAMGTPISVVSKLLRHSNITTTMNTYTHLFRERLPQGAAAIDKAFGQ